MQEILTESVRLVNLPFTVLLVGLLIYWLLVTVGFLHFDTGADSDVQVGGDAGTELGVEGHADVGVHAGGEAQGGFETSADAAGDAGHEASDTGDGADHDPGGESHGLGWLAGVMKFVHLGDVPAMVVISVQALCMWMGAMIANHYWNQEDPTLLKGLAFAVPNVLLSAVITRYLTWPMAKFFRALNREYAEHQPIVGRTCVVITSEVTEQFGQAQVETRGAPVIINVRTTQQEPLRKGDTALVVREAKPAHVFYVRKVTSEKLEV